MKLFVLTQPYANLEEMLGSAEVGIYKEELQQGNIEKYAIVSRIGNRYDLNGNRIEDFADNPFLVKEDIPVFCENTDKEILEDKTMKYLDIEKLIDAEVEKAVSEVKASYENEIEVLKQSHAQEIEELNNVHEEEKVKIKAEVINDLLNKLKG